MITRSQHVMWDKKNEKHLLYKALEIAMSIVNFRILLF